MNLEKEKLLQPILNYSLFLSKKIVDNLYRFISILVSIIAAIEFSNYSVESFSNNLKELANEKMYSALQKLTGSILKGLLTGFLYMPSYKVVVL